MDPAEAVIESPVTGASMETDEIALPTDAVALKPVKGTLMFKNISTVPRADVIANPAGSTG